MSPNTKTRLLDASIEAFGGLGYAATHVDYIVEQAACTKPSLYYHFTCKAGLFEASLTEALARVTAPLLQVVEGGEHVSDWLEPLLRALQDVARRMPDEFRMIVTANADPTRPDGLQLPLRESPLLQAMRARLGISGEREALALIIGAATVLARLEAQASRPHLDVACLARLLLGGLATPEPPPTPK